MKMIIRNSKLETSPSPSHPNRVSLTTARKRDTLISRGMNILTWSFITLELMLKLYKASMEEERIEGSQAS